MSNEPIDPKPPEASDDAAADAGPKPKSKKGGWRPGSGRPKGAKTGYRQRRAPKGVLPSEIIDVAKKELMALGPVGREMDEIGILRSVGMATMGLYARELGQDGPDANERRKTLAYCFGIIHKAQLDAIRAFGLAARNLQSLELPSITALANTHTEPQLQDWRIRIPEDK